MRISKPVRPAFMPPAISRAGPIRIRRKRFASNIGWSQSAWGRPPPATCWGIARPFDDAPFFWSQHYDVPINYVGHAETWDEIAVEGSIPDKDCLVRFKRGGRLLAVASIYRDLASLQAEVAMERQAA